MRASQSGHHKSVEVLAKNRANMQIQDNDGAGVLTVVLVLVLVF